MPGSWDPQVYRERAQQWRHAAAALPPGETQNAYISLSKGYEDLATLIEIDGMGEKRRTQFQQSTPHQILSSSTQIPIAPSAAPADPT
jgi:hypothetical protein